MLFARTSTWIMNRDVLFKHFCNNADSRVLLLPGRCVHRCARAIIYSQSIATLIIHNDIQYWKASAIRILNRIFWRANQNQCQRSFNSIKNLNYSCLFRVCLKIVLHITELMYAYVIIAKKRDSFVQTEYQFLNNVR